MPGSLQKSEIFLQLASNFRDFRAKIAIKPWNKSFLQNFALEFPKKNGLKLSFTGKTQLKVSVSSKNRGNWDFFCDLSSFRVGVAGRLQF